MSSIDNSIKFALDIKAPHITFLDYFFKLENGIKRKIYQAGLEQPACPFCSSVNIIHNGCLQTNIRYITANASSTVTIRLFK